jgi:hypothetical protein
LQQSAVLRSSRNTRSAGILVVVSAGNSGSGCGTVNTPAAIYDAVSGSSVNSQNNISSFSSRGGHVDSAAPG